MSTRVVFFLGCVLSFAIVVPPASATETHVVPHVVYGGGFRTVITITNTSLTANPVTLNVLSQGGLLVRQVNYNIAPSASVRYETDSTLQYGPSVTQWAIVRSTAQVGVNIFYDFRLSATTPIINAVGFNDVPPDTQFTFPAEFAPAGNGLLFGRTVGLALANPNNAATVTVTLNNAAGASLATYTVSLNSFQQTAFDLSQVPSFANAIGGKSFIGSITVTSTSPISALGLEDDDGPFYATPAFNSPVLQPNWAIAGSAAFTLNVFGSNFASGATVTWNGTPRTTTFVSSTKLAAAITASDVALSGVAQIQVLAPDGTVLGSTSFYVSDTLPSGAPLPSKPVLRVVPHLTHGGALASRVRIVNLSSTPNVVEVRTIDQSGTQASATTITLAAGEVTAIDTTDAQRKDAPTTQWMTVGADAPIGVNIAYDIKFDSPGVINAVGFNDAAPARQFIFPVEFQPVGGALTVGRTTGLAVANITGSANTAYLSLLDATGVAIATYQMNLTAYQQVAVDLSNIAAFKSALPAADFVGTLEVTANLPVSAIALGDDDGPFFATPTFAPALPAPTSTPVISALSPVTLAVSDQQRSVVVTGTGFLPTSSVMWNGATASTTYISPTQLQFLTPVGALAAPGTAQVTVSNGVSGGTSLPAVLTVVNPTAVISSLSPVATMAGTPGLTLTINGSGFLSTVVVNWAGSPHAYSYVSATQLQVPLTAAELATPASVAVQVVNPGTAASSRTFYVTAIPSITLVTPSSLIVGSPDTPISVSGTGFVPGSVVQWNGANLATAYLSATALSATVPAVNLTSTGTFNITVQQPVTSGGQSAPKTITVAPPPPPTVSYMSPTGAAVGSSGVKLNVTGSNFTNKSVVRFNGQDRPTTFSSSSSLSATLLDSDVQTFGISAVTVFTPNAGSSSSLPFTTYLGLATNDLVYSPSAGVFYASIPSSAGPPYGNTVVTIDPYSGTVGNPIWVGSEPGKMAVSDDGSTMWVALNGSFSVRKVDLVNKVATGVQITVPGDSHLGNTAVGEIAVMPGSPATIALATNGIVIYDNGVARAKTYGSYYTFYPSNLAMTFGDASTLYAVGGSALYRFAIDATGVASSTSSNLSTYSNDVVYDSGRLYLTSGAVLDAASGSQLGTFSASGPVAVDSAAKRAFVLANANVPSGSGQAINAYDTNTFLPAGNIALSGLDTSSYPYAAASLLRWGADGLAFRTNTQVFVLRSAVVKDLSTNPADLGISLSVPQSVNSVANFTFDATIANAGPNGATKVNAWIALPPSMALISATPSQGACQATVAANGKTSVNCALGSMGNGATATIHFSAAALSTGNAQLSAMVSAAEGDVNASNNATTATIALNGTATTLTPAIAKLTPQAVAAGSATFALTVNGTQFLPGATIQWNGNALATTYVGPTQLTVSVPAANIASLGWGNVTVLNPGSPPSAPVPLSIYKVVNLTANAMAYDPFTRQLYASIPSTATEVSGNSIVPIDPSTGTIGTPIFIGSEPKRVAISDDGQFLYTVLSGSNEVRRLDLPTQTPGTRFTVQTPTGLTTTPFAPDDLAVLPGNHDVIATSKYANAVQVWDINSTGATLRGIGGFVYSGNFLAWGDASHLYSYDSGLSPSKLHRFNVTSTSVTEVDETNLTGFGGRMIVSNGLIYSGYGGVSNPLPTPPVLVGRYGLSTYFCCGDSFPALDAGERMVFFSGVDSAGNRSLQSFNQDTFSPLGALQLTTGQSFGNTPSDLSRWGRDGLAFRTLKDYTSSGVSQIVLVRGPFVVPQWLTNNATPSVTNVSPNSAAVGSGNRLITVTGSGFVPGAVVLWGGAERTTYFVDANTLRFAAPAADFAKSGSTSVTVQNPNSGSSGALTFSVN